MKLTLNQELALFVVRAIRSGMTAIPWPCHRINLAGPDPSPYTRWTRARIETMLEQIGISASSFADNIPLTIAMSYPNKRVQVKGTKNTVYSKGVPPYSFLDLGGGLAIPCPELLFIEMGALLDLPEHLLLGQELCGSYSRNPSDPQLGTSTLGIPAVTSRKRIQAYLSRTSYIRGMDQAEQTLALLSDNAWSPSESLVATLVCLPLEYGG